MICKFCHIHAAPSPPEDVVSEEVGVTWIYISWDSPSVDIVIVSYIVTAASESDEVIFSVTGSERELNVTGLQPGTEYTLTVVSTSDEGELSSPSIPLIATTFARLGELTIRI